MKSWPAIAGYDDHRLESLSALASRSQAGRVPWVSWEPENSSFGKTLREWSGYPDFLPLCISSDHGVHWGATCWPNEVRSRFETFFSWNGKKVRRMRELHGKHAFHVPHPWLAHRRAFHPVLPEARSGTIVFFTHSNSKTTPVFESIDAYMAGLAALPEKCQPVVICLSFHDIAKGLHKTLRKFGFPLVTAGTTNAQCFVDRFYSLVGQFRYSTSPTIGSHTFYLLEAGIPFFLFGHPPEYHIRGSDAVRDGVQNLADYGDEEDIERLMDFRRMLSMPVDAVTAGQHEAALRYLGADAATSPQLARRALWKAMIRHAPWVVRTYIGKALRRAGTSGSRA